MLATLRSLFLSHPWLRALAVIVGAILLAEVVRWLVDRGLARWAQRTKTDFDDRLIALLHGPVRISVVLIGLGWATSILGLPHPYAEHVVSLLQTLATVVWMLFAMHFASMILEVLSRHQDRFPIIDDRTVVLFSNTASVVLAGTGVYFIFLAWNVDVTAWLASAGIIGIAVGFAAKDTLANLFAGIFIIADAPYKLGDYINLDTGERGRVTHIGIRSTRLLTRDDVEITIPNAVIANAKIVNESGGPSQKERLRVKVGVAYGSDIDQVREILTNIATQQTGVCEEPTPRVRFRAFGDSSLDFELLCWIDEPASRGLLTDALLTATYKAFAKAGVEIPYPKRDVYVHQVVANPAIRSPA